MTEEMESRKEMIFDFLNESREMLDDIEPKITEFERHAVEMGTVDQDILNAIFRLFHSIKGMASFLDLQIIMNVTHEAETLLDLLRKGKMAVETGDVDLLYRTTDFIRGLLDKVEFEFSDEQYAGDAASILAELKQVISRGTSTTNAEIVSELCGCLENENIEEHYTGATGEKSPETDELQSTPLETQFAITSDIVRRFCDEAVEIFEDVEAALLDLEHESGGKELVERVFRGFHSFKGNSAFFGYSEFEQISHKAETVLYEIREQGGLVEPAIISILLSVIDALREGVQCLDSEKIARVKNKGKLEALLARINAAPQCTGPEVTAEMDLTEGSKSSTRTEETEEVRDVIKIVKHPKEEISKKDDGDKKIAVRQNAIRVDVDKLDLLLDMVGELVIAEAMVSYSPDLQGFQLDRFERAVLQLTKITRDIQDIAMSMRMIPLAGVFSKMVRLVRDLAVKANKKIDLQIIGEDTEVDKTIIEQISDPLVHIIRNAADHGLETAEERLALGKPEIGRIMLEAKHAAGEVWIVVKDDGRGLNREGILQKALAKGLVKDDNLKDDEVWKLIFEPGLSTAEKVSSISGRGVGMDVVKRNIEKLRGRIDIRSNYGQGTAFIIKIPLTLAIIEGMVVRVGKSRYTIPIVSIKESFRPNTRQVVITPGGSEIVNIRGELLPIIRMHELYKVTPAFQQLDEGILIVVESEARKCCLFVDELIGQQQVVIKGLSEYLGTVRGVSGFAILGGGEVSMILDISGLMDSLQYTTENSALSYA